MSMMFDNAVTMEYTKRFPSKHMPISRRYHSDDKLRGYYKPKEKKSILDLEINTPYNREQLLAHMTPPQSIEVFLAALPSKVAEDLLKNQEHYDNMKWEDVRVLGERIWVVREDEGVKRSEKRRVISSARVQYA